MPITLQDYAPLEKVRRLSDGRIAAVAKFARSGVYRYTGAEIGRSDLAEVAVYRPEAEVFDEAAMASFAHKAITIGHPSSAVTADNWKQVSVGWTEGKVARDGQYVEIPLMLADASAVQAYDGGSARELSAGYQCELTWGDGVAPDGSHYQATQRQIRGDHIALVAAGRAGSECRIGDAGAFKMDNATIDAAISFAVAERRAAHHRKFAWMDDGAPAFDEQAARLIETSKQRELADRMVRDSTRDAQHDPYLQAAAAMSEAAYQRSKSTPNDWRNEPHTNESMRNFARDSRY